MSERGSRRRRRRGAKVVGASAAVVAVGAAAAAAFGLTAGGSTPSAASDLPPATAAVTRQTLGDTESVDGSLGYGPTTKLAARLAGTATWVPTAGAVVSRGGTLYSVDRNPVVLLYGSIPAYRTLASGVEGADVLQLERNLKALGYTGFTVDDEYTWSTAAAVKEWQEDLGVTETGRVELGSVVFAASAVRVDSASAALGQPLAPGQEVLAYTGTARVVTVRLDVADQRLARKGTKVQVRLPDGKNVAGTIDRIYTVVEEASNPNEDAQTKVEALVSLASSSATKGLDVAAVSVLFTAAQHKDVLTVPIAALVALSEGGYGVEVVDGTSSHYVAVETGLFANGRVEVKGEGLAEGATVGMPS